MRKWMRILSLLLVGCLLVGVPALAEDVCTVQDALTASEITTDEAYLRLGCELAAEGNVTVTVQDEWGYLVYQRDYGVCAGSFRSSDIYLPLEGSRAVYTVTLETAGGVNTFTVIREMAMITDTAVYAVGLTLQEMADGSAYKYAVVLDLAALNETTAVAPLLASGAQVGEAYFSVLEGVLTVSALLTAEGSIDKAEVYIATDALTARDLGAKHFNGMKAELDQEIDLGDAPYAAVMVQLTLTYDPTTAQAWEMTREEEENFKQLQEDWMLMQQLTAGEAVG